MNREAGQAQSGDVDLFDRTLRIAQAIEGRFRYKLQAGGAQLFEKIA